MKVWNGSSWVSATALKVWNGSSWVEFFSLGTPDISNKTTNVIARAYDSGSASASIEHVFYSDKNYEIFATAVGLPANEETVEGDFGFMSNWLIGGSAADFSMKYTFSGNALSLVQIGGVDFPSTNTYYPLTGDVPASFNLNVNQFAPGFESRSSTVTISIARTTDLSTVLDTAVLTMSVSAEVSDSSFPD
jgi:hypothetical protein